MPAAGTAYAALKLLARKLIDPLRADESITHFTLAIPDAQTTTVDSVQGWDNRPPATLRCAGCETAINQPRPSHEIDCPYCYRTYPADDFADLELLEMTCPRCETTMNHGRRHPKMFDIPEYATCPSCQYHWDLNHWF